MKLWKSKKSAATSCVSAVSGKLNLGGNKSGYKDDDQNETISAAATPTNQSTINLANGLHQGELVDATCAVFGERTNYFSSAWFITRHAGFNLVLGKFRHIFLLDIR